MLRLLGELAILRAGMKAVGANAETAVAVRAQRKNFMVQIS